MDDVWCSYFDCGTPLVDSHFAGRPLSLQDYEIHLERPRSDMTCYSPFTLSTEDLWKRVSPEPNPWIELKHLLFDILPTNGVVALIFTYNSDYHAEVVRKSHSSLMYKLLSKDRTFIKGEAYQKMEGVEYEFKGAEKEGGVLTIKAAKNHLKRKAGEAISALANTQGGTVLLGIYDDDGRIQGIRVGGAKNSIDDFKRDVVNIITQKLKPFDPKIIRIDLHPVQYFDPAVRVARPPPAVERPDIPYVTDLEAVLEEYKQHLDRMPGLGGQKPDTEHFVLEIVVTGDPQSVVRWDGKAFVRVQSSSRERNRLMEEHEIQERYKKQFLKQCQAEVFQKLTSACEGAAPLIGEGIAKQLEEVVRIVFSGGRA